MGSGLRWRLGLFLACAVSCASFAPSAGQVADPYAALSQRLQARSDQLDSLSELSEQLASQRDAVARVAQTLQAGSPPQPPAAPALPADSSGRLGTNPSASPPPASEPRLHCDAE